MNTDEVSTVNNTEMFVSVAVFYYFKYLSRCFWTSPIEPHYKCDLSKQKDFVLNLCCEFK